MDGYPLHADIAFTRLASDFIDGDRELGDGSVRNLTVAVLNTLHRSDVNLKGTLNAGIADKTKEYAKTIDNHEIIGCMALVIDAGGGMSKQLLDLTYCLPASGRRTPPDLNPASNNDKNDTAFAPEHIPHTADELRKMKDALQRVRIRGR